jgi:hypothetical protein
MHRRPTVNLVLKYFLKKGESTKTTLLYLAEQKWPSVRGRNVLLGTNCLLNFALRLDKILKYNIKITTFRKLVRLPSSGDGRGDTQIVPFRLS